MNKAYKYRLYPDCDQEQSIKKTFGCVRYIYNKMLTERKMIYEVYGNDKENLKQQKYRLPADYKKEHSWLKEVDSLALANAQMNLDAAYRNFYRDPKTGSPKFKSKRSAKKSYTTNDQKGSIRITGPNTIRLPKLKDIKIKMHRPIPEDQLIKSATLSLTSTGKYFISILVEYEKNIETIAPKKEKILGLDYSSGMLYIDSEGNSCGYPGYYRKAEERLKKAQRKLSARSKGGKNWDKQRNKVARLHEKVVNQRKDFLDKTSRQIANAYDGVAVENLNMRAMAQCLNLAKSTNDNGFGRLRSMLEYKLKEQGKQMVIIQQTMP